MVALVFRLIGCLILAAGTAFAIGDIARSLSAEALRLTSVAQAAALLSGEASAAAAPGAETSAFGPLLGLVGDWPVSPSLAALAILCLLIGRRRSRPAYQR